VKNQSDFSSENQSAFFMESKHFLFQNYKTKSQISCTDPTTTYRSMLH
jgi:hypothetical protein